MSLFLLLLFWVEDVQLGGGFKHFLFSSLFGEDSHFDQYFSNGLKPPTSQCVFVQKEFSFFQNHNITTLSHF